MSYGAPRAAGPRPLVVIGIVIIAVALLLLCGALYIFTGGFGFNRPQGAAATPPPQPDLDIPTAREAYPAAVKLIREQDPGAELASAAGAWTPNIKIDNLNTGRTGWTFHFYLPISNTFAWVTVDRGGTVHLNQTIEWQTPPTLINDQGWQIDSAEAVSTAVQSCGAAIESDPEATVEARLSLAASNRALLWRITVKPFPSAQPCVVNIDATTGGIK